MRRHTSPAKPSLRPIARPAVEPFEQRIPVAESVGMALAMRALADAAAVRAAQTSPPPPLYPD